MPKPGVDADDAARTEADHFMVCPGCGQRFDMRDMEQVAERIHDGDFEIGEVESPNPTRCVAVYISGTDTPAPSQMPWRPDSEG